MLDDITPEADTEVEAEFEVAVEPEVEAEFEEVPVKTPKRSKSAAVEVEVDAIPPVAEETEPVPGGPVIHMRALVYSATRKNSGSVAVLQGRLSDVGYAAARGDLKGWFHDHTRAALIKWQTENGLEVTGTCEFEDMRFLFDGTSVEILP